jgi:hypothetical protein
MNFFKKDWFFYRRYVIMIINKARGNKAFCGKMKNRGKSNE